MNKEKMMSIGAIVLVVGVVAGLAIFGASKVKKPVASTTTSASVATVNGVAITKETYDAQLATAISAFKSQGVNTDDTAKLAEIKTQVLNDLISNELVAQGVVSAGVKVTDADVEKQFQAVLAQVGGAEKLKEQLIAAKLTEAQLRINISKQLAIQAYLLQNIDMSTATATDAEAKKFYDDNAKGQANVPAYKDVSAQIKQQIVANKQQLLINAFVASLRSKAKVETSL